MLSFIRVAVVILSLQDNKTLTKTYPTLHTTIYNTKVEEKERQRGESKLSLNASHSSK